jgi:hypothetical protein
MRTGKGTGRIEVEEMEMEIKREEEDKNKIKELYTGGVILPLTTVALSGGTGG